MRSLLMGAAAALVLGAGAVSAAQISYTSSVAVRSTNFSDIAGIPQIPQFDPSLGTLNSVELILTGRVTGNAQLESLDAAPATVNYQLGANVSASISTFLTTADTFAFTDSINFTAFDGTIDFGGTSGATFSGLSASATASEVGSSAALLAFVTGNGFYDVLVSGSGNSLASGAGNIVTLFATNAGGDIEVVYNYTPPTGEVPVPAALPLLATALGALGVWRIRRKA